jgi:hypothetical protein
MKRQIKHLLLYVALLALTQGVAVILTSWDVLAQDSSLYYLLIFGPILIVPLVFGFMLRSWRQFLVYLSVTVLGWQLSFVAFDWMAGHLSDPLWLKDKEGAWGSEILGRCIMPAILISVGAIMGRLKRAPRLR